MTQTQIVRWTELGIIIPERDARGRGKTRTYNHQNLIEAVICKELNMWRMETLMMHDILDYLRTGNLWGDETLDDAERVPMWNMLKDNQKTDRMLICISVRWVTAQCSDGTERDMPDLRIRLRSPQEVASTMSRHSSTLVINLRKILDEVGQF